MISFIISALKIIILLGFLVFIHESGHFIIAKLCKVRVNEFAIGFGPTVWKKQGKITKYALRLIPLGGFVSMEGEEEKSEKEDSFSKASVPKRIAIVAAGGFVNIVFALVVYFVVMASTSPYITNEVEKVLEGYPAEVYEIEQGDKIIEANGKKISNKNDLTAEMLKSDGNEINYKIERNGQILEFNIKPKEENQTYYIGVEFKKSEDTFGNRLLSGMYETKDFILSIGKNLQQIFTGNVGIDQMVGPVGISGIVSKTNGFVEFIYLMALISMSLGVTNLLPIPALDGGKILILIIEAIRRKPMNQENEMKIQLLGFAFLITLALIITYNDIVNLL